MNNNLYQMNIILQNDSEDISITNPFHLGEESLLLQNDAAKEIRTFLCVSQSGHGSYYKWRITDYLTKLYNIDYPLSNDINNQASSNLPLGNIFIVESTKSKEELDLCLINIDDITSDRKNYLQHSKAYLLALLNSDIHILHLHHKPNMEAVNSLNNLIQVINKIYGDIASSKIPSFIILIHGIDQLKIKGIKCDSMAYLYDYILRNKIDNSILTVIKIIEVIIFPISHAQSQNELLKNSNELHKFGEIQRNFVQSLENINETNFMTRPHNNQAKIDEIIELIMNNAKPQSLSIDKYYNNLISSIDQISKFQIPKMKLKVRFDEMVMEVIPKCYSEESNKISHRDIIFTNKIAFKIKSISEKRAQIARIKSQEVNNRFLLNKNDDSVILEDKRVKERDHCCSIF